MSPTIIIIISAVISTCISKIMAEHYKLLGMENVTKIKTRYYKKGLRIFANFLGNKAIKIDASKIVPTFTRAMPKNLLEISQIVANLWGKVGKKTLLSQIPFVEDPDEELKTVEREAQEAAKQQREMFGIGGNAPPLDAEGEEAEETADGKPKERKPKGQESEKDGRPIVLGAPAGLKHAWAYGGGRNR